jgi:hypothetical protein
LIPAGTGLSNYRFLDIVIEPETTAEEVTEALNIE